MHRDGLGWTLSIIEEVAFLGFISVLLFVFFGRISFKEIWNETTTGSGNLVYYYRFLKYSIIGYPILIVISTLCEKTGIIYDDEYTDMPVVGLLFFNIWNDIIFPIYALANVTQAPAAVLTAVGAWIAYAIFLCFRLK